MSDLSALKKRREQPLFADWKGNVPDEGVQASQSCVRQLIDDLIALGEAPDEDAARAMVAACVGRFNELDDGWITTIEREDIADAIASVVELAGFEFDEDWIGDREW